MTTKNFFLRLSFSVGVLLTALRVDAQTIDIGPNEYAFQYTLDSDFGLLFNAADSRYEFMNGSATPVFGFSAANGRMTTNIQFDPNADLLIGNDRYAFRAASNPNFGLFFNAGETEYQFLDNSAQPVFSVNANTGRFDNDVLFNPGKSVVVAPGEFGLRSLGLPNAGLVFGLSGYEFKTASGNTEVYIDATTGDMGIGTTTPTAKLSVNGTSNFTDKVSIGSDAPLPPSFFYEVKSNVGSTFRVFDFPGGLLGEWSNADGNNGARVRYAGFSDSQIFWDLGQTADNEFVLTGSGQNALWVTPTGETGLGTNEPTERLDVAGQARVRSLPNNDLLENVIVADADGVLHTRSASSLGGSGSSLWTQSGTDTYYNEGNVGIGTSSPGAKLDVDGDIKAGTSILSSSQYGGNIELKPLATGDRNAWIDFHSSDDPGQSDYSFRILRSAGANGGTEMGHIGASTFRIRTWTPGSSLRFNVANNGDAMTINDQSNVGIGTSSPGAKLDVNGAMRASNFTTGSTKFNVVSNRRIEHVESCLPAGGAFMYADFWGCSNEFNFIEFRRGSTGMKFRVTQGGNVYADGKVTCREAEVTLASFPDYVFKPGYDLMTLGEVDAFIQENGHLPNMPTEAEVVKNGLNLGEINVKLVEKVEELTLHLIEKEKQYDDLKSRLELLEKALLEKE